VLFVNIEMRHAPFYGWIKDLSVADPTSIFNAFGLIPWTPPEFMLIGAWPVFMGLTMWLQQRLNPQPTDPVQAKIFMFLHFRGVDLNRQDSSGSAPLHECSSRNLSRPVRLLVDAGALVNNRHGRTGMIPLQVACANDDPDVETIRSLLEKGAHPNWRDADNLTAFEYVLRKNMVPVVKSPPAEERPLSSDGPARAMSPQTPDEMAQTVADVGLFVTKALPVLIELTRKGARYTPEQLRHLRPSFLVSWHAFRFML